MPPADTSYLQLPVECGRTEGKGLWVALAFFVLYVIMFRVSGWLIQGSHINKTGSDRVPLPIPCRSLCVPSKFWLVQNVGPLWLPAPGLTHWKVYLLGVMLNSHHHESTRILSSRGNVAAMCKWGVRECGCCPSSSAHTPSMSIWTLLKKHKFKDNIVKNFKIVTAEH